LAAMVRVPVVRKVREHEPEGAVPLQLSFVLAFTVTLPVGVSVSPAGGRTEKLALTCWPAIAVLGTTERLVEVAA